jgi:hypothetical protein
MGINLADSAVFQALPDLATEQQRRRATPKGAAPSRLQVKEAKRTDERKEETAWKRAIWKRDHGLCRWCHRVCRRCLDLAPDRGECHHVSGRVVREIRWDVRNGLLLCAACHERITGRVAEKSLIHSKHTFTVDSVAYLNANKPVRFQRVA